MASPFTLQLVSLRCVTAQEHDGDEIYITAADRTLWSVGGLRMSSRLDDDQLIDEVDFLHGQLHTRDGWVAMQTFERDDYRLDIDGDRAQVQVWERDMLLSDDLIGEAIVTANDAGHGNIQLAFTGEGAHYMFTYQVITTGEA